MYKYHRCTFTSKWHFSLQARSKSRSADHNTGHRLSPGEWERLINCYGNDFDMIWSLILLWSGIIHKVKVIIVQFHVGGQYGVMQNEWFGNEEENYKIEVDDKMTTRWWRDGVKMKRWRDNHQEAFALFTRSSDEDGNEITTDELGKVGFLSFFAIDFYLFLIAQTLHSKPFFCSSCLYFLLLLLYMKCFSVFLLPLFVCL